MVNKNRYEIPEEEHEEERPGIAGMGNNNPGQTESEAVNEPVHALSQRDDACGHNFGQIGPDQGAEGETVHDEDDGLEDEDDDWVEFQGVENGQHQVADTDGDGAQLECRPSAQVFEDGIGEEAGDKEHQADDDGSLPFELRMD